MKVKQVRDDIKVIAKEILLKHGFITATDGDYIKKEDNGDRFCITLSEVKDRASFSISVRVSANYKNIEKLFPKDKLDPEYVLNCRLGSESISFDDYSQKRLADILERLIDSFALPFLTSISTEEKVIENLSSEDSNIWLTSDIVSRYKFRFSSAILNNNADMISNYLNETDKLLSKPWADQYKTQLKKVCEYASKSM